MWDRIHFTPEEEHALEEAERAIARSALGETRHLPSRGRHAAQEAESQEYRK